MEEVKKNLRLRAPAKATVWYIASSAIARAIGVLSTPIFTRLLTPEEYGLYPLYNTWLGVLTVIVTLELTGGVMYRGLQKFSDQKDDFISASFGLFIFVFVAFCTLYFAFGSFFSEIIGLSTRVMILMFIQIFANSVISFYIAKARFMYEYKSVASLNLLSSLGVPLISVALVLLTNIKAEARIIGSCLTIATIAIPIGYSLVKQSNKLYDKDVWRFLLKFSLPLLPHYFAMTLMMRISEISVGRFFGTDALGKYSVAVSVGMVLTIVTTGLLSSLSPWMLRKLSAGETDKIKDFLFLTTKALALTCLMILAVAPEIIRILTPSVFHASLPGIYPLEIAVIPMFLSNALMSAGMYYERSGLSGTPSIIAATVSTILAIAVLPHLDYRFAGVFVLVSYLLLAVLNALVFKRLSGTTPIYVKKSLSVFALTIGYAVLLFLFRNVLISRIILTLPLIPLLFTLGKQIISDIRE